MNLSRNAWIALSGLVILAVIAYFSEKGGTPGDHPWLESRLIPIDKVDEVEAIQIIDGDQSVRLKRHQESLWVVEADVEFPAEASKVVRLMDQLNASKIERIVSNDKDKWESLEISPSRQLSITGLKPKALTIFFGKQSRSGGQFVAFEDSNESFVTSPAVNLDAKAENWYVKTILDLNKSDIVSVTAKSPEASWTLKRDAETGNFQLQDKPAGEQENLAAIDKVLASFANLHYTNRLQASQLTSPTRLIQLTVETQAEDRFILTAYRANQADQTDTNAKPEGKANKTRYWLRISLESSPQESLKSMINHYFKDWLFEVEDFKVEALLQKPAALLQAITPNDKSDGS